MSAGYLNFSSFQQEISKVDYLVCGETDFILGENRLGYNMNL